MAVGISARSAETHAGDGLSDARPAPKVQPDVASVNQTRDQFNFSVTIVQSNFAPISSSSRITPAVARVASFFEKPFLRIAFSIRRAT